MAVLYMVANPTSPENPPTIGLIGAGNMARSLAGGLLASGWPKDKLILSDPDDGQRAAVERHLGLGVFRDNRDKKVVHSRDIHQQVFEFSAKLRIHECS